MSSAAGTESTAGVMTDSWGTRAVPGCVPAAGTTPAEQLYALPEELQQALVHVVRSAAGLSLAEKQALAKTWVSFGRRAAQAHDGEAVDVLSAAVGAVLDEVRYAGSQHGARLRRVEAVAKECARS